MTDPTIAGAAIVTILAAVGSVVVQIINALSASRDRREAAFERALNISKQDALLVGNARIHELTNSTNSNLQRALDVMSEKVQGLEAMQRQMDRTRVDTAQKQLLSEGRIDAAMQMDAHPLVGVSQAIDRIDDNTAGIQRNTNP